MFKLLNKFAWIISILLGIITFQYFSYFLYLGSSNIVLGILLGLIYKKIFFSKKHIKSRLEFFANSLGENYIANASNTTKKQVSKKEEIIKEDIKEIENFEMLEGEVKVDNFSQLKENTSNYKNLAEKIPKKIIQEKPSKIAIAIKKFFSENLLAKLGSILIFLGVLFLLGLVYNKIGAVGKLIIGFLIGFSIFGAGIVLEKKKLYNESKILLGAGILINYLVILSGRHLIGDSINNNILSTGTTFLFLIFNTVFAVVTSLVYKSRTLLLFSFIFAFINPLLVGGSSDNPYTLIGYSLIISFGGLFLSLKQKDILLAIGIFILGNILFLIAPFNSDIHWIIKLISSTIISLSSIFVIYKLDIKKLAGVFIGSYIFLILLLSDGGIYIKETTSFISYMITIVVYFSLGIYYFLKTSFNSLIYILITPLLIILGLSFSGISMVFSLATIVLIYLVGYNYLQDKLPNFLKYIFFSVLGIYIFLTNSFLSLESINLDLASFITILITSFIFIFTSYYLSTKKDLGFLYSIGTIGGILTLAPILVTKTITNNRQIFNTIDDGMNIDTTTIFYLSIISLIIFAISNWILPFINKNLQEKKHNLKNLLISIVTGLLFLGYELFNYGNIHFPGISLGFAFAVLAIIYFIMAYMMINIIGIEKVKKDESSKNIIYSYIGISISIFSLAIALIFSEYQEIVSTVWLFEATIMFYFYNKTKESKIFVAGIILFMVGIFKLFNLIDLVQSKDYLFLIPFSIIFISLIINIKYLNIIKNSGKRVFHDILHILGIATLGILLLQIIPSTGHGWSILGITIFISITNLIYSYFDSKILKIFFVTLFTGFLFLHLGEVESIFRKIDRNNLEHLRILQYISTLILGGTLFLWNKINKQKSLNIFLNIVFSIYLLLITSLYIYDIFNTTFAITIYWGITASILLFYGLGKDIIKLRTLGLYLVSLTALKIFFYDIWYGIDDAISRVVALIVIGILFIIISTKYTKKYGNNLAGEFSIKNLSNNNKLTTPIKQKSIKKETPKKTIIKKVSSNKNFIVNEKIENIDIGNISSVQFIFKDEKINIRAINLIKIVKLVINKYKGQTKFKKNELKEIYKQIKDNYHSDLSKANYDKIIIILEKFINEGGEVKLIEK